MAKTSKEIEKAFIRAFALLGDDRILSVARLGYTTVNYSRLMSRDVNFYRQLAREMSELTTLSEDMLFRQMVQDRNDSWMKNPRGEDARYFRDAAESLLNLLPKVPDRSRKVLVMRMHGKSWRNVADANPSRVLFSLRDDYDSDLLSLYSRFSNMFDRLI